MKKIIYKYPLHTNDWTYLVLPSGAKPLYVDQQSGHIQLWVEQDEKPDRANGINARCFITVPTGEVFHLSGVHRYLGTVLAVQGALVWHVYEITKNNDVDA